MHVLKLRLLRQSWTLAGRGGLCPGRHQLLPGLQGEGRHRAAEQQPGAPRLRGRRGWQVGVGLRAAFVALLGLSWPVGVGFPTQVSSSAALSC